MRTIQGDDLTTRQPPVFLVAAERSGTLLLRRMLSRHPQIAITGKFDFLVDAISPDGRLMKRDAFVRRLERDPEFAALGLQIRPGLNFAGLANDFLDQVARPKDANIVGATLHHDFDKVLRLWPDARFIHLVRDGRDVGLSVIPIGLAGNMWRGIRQWVAVEALWARLSAKVLAERQITIKFEKFASNAEHELRRIADFLGVAYEPEMLRHDAPAAYIQALNTGVGKWRDAKPSDLSAAEHRSARWLLQNGYFLGGSVRPPSAYRRIFLATQDRIAIGLHRKRTFGTRLWLAGIFAGVLGSKRKARITRRKNEILARKRM